MALVLSLPKPSSTAPGSCEVPAFRVERIGIALALFEPKPEFLIEQLASIVAQTWTAWTCIVTADSPLAELRTNPRCAPFFADARFQWHENSRRRGFLANFERAIQLCVSGQADAIACCDQDDVWEVDKLAALAAALEKVGPLALVHSDLSILSTDGTMCRGDSVWTVEQRGIAQVSPEHLLVRNVVTGCAMLFDAELARRMPMIPEAARYHDRWYALIAACHGGVHGVPKPLVRYRQHGSQAVGMRAGMTITTVFPAFLAWVRETDLTEWARQATCAWRSYVLLSEAVTRLGLVAPRRRNGWYVFLLGIRWVRRDVNLCVHACVLALGSVMALREQTSRPATQ